MNDSLLKHFGLLLLFWLVGSRVSLAQDLNLALGKTTTASSLENGNYPASNATDGQQGTRWSSEFNDNQSLVVDLGSVQTIDRVRISWEVAYGRDFVLQVSNNATNWTTVQTVTANAPALRNNQYVNELTDLNRAGVSIGRYVRMFGSARETQYGFSIFEFEVFSFSNAAASLASGRPSSASNTQASYVPALAFDGNENTRWSTLGVNNQTLDVDLQGRATISRIYLNWELAYGVNFRLQVSDDRVTWTTFATYSNNQAYYNEAAVIASGRYVRMQGDDGGQNGGGFSIWELRLFGTVEPLPVSLVSFAAAAQGTGVAVSWTTATEQNNAGFEVQRSADGTSFSTLTTVPGAGNSQTIKKYQYTDELPLATTAYYRLRQFDLDGQATYSPVVTVQPLARALATISVYPNPTADQATVEWDALAASSARWSLTNSTGQVVTTGTLAAQPGHNARAIDLRAYAAGSYVLTVEANGQVLGRQRLQKN